MDKDDIQYFVNKYGPLLKKEQEDNIAEITNQYNKVQP
jgi:hypothetical protein